MNLFDALIFGIVEGVTEFLPISSTGHLMLSAQVMGLGQTNFLKSFEIAIQLGAILSVVVLYWNKFLVDFEVLKRALAAFLPTAVLGFFLYKIIKKFLLNSPQVVLWSLFLGGILLIIFECLHREKELLQNSDLRHSEEHSDEESHPEKILRFAQNDREDLAKISYRKAFIIGIFQSLAMIPGVSRAAATIIGGLLLGLKRRTIVEFSFLLAVPTMLAATALDLLKSAHEFSSGQMEFLLVGFVSSFAVALLSIKFLLHFIKNHTFIWFGVYRIAVALLFWFVIS
ncbi:MAG TPA: undecaprenyl-diphosphate phosphatase [Candidatus Omnitrophota bacterium]|nr:undecaprenyl-diphosphate phosphatase [Candidatus Omnitrophota bacterium]